MRWFTSRSFSRRHTFFANSHAAAVEIVDFVQALLFPPHWRVGVDSTPMLSLQHMALCILQGKLRQHVQFFIDAARCSESSQSDRNENDGQPLGDVVRDQRVGSGNLPCNCE